MLVVISFTIPDLATKSIVYGTVRHVVLRLLLPDLVTNILVMVELDMLY
jgi:hypothetical protein